MTFNVGHVQGGTNAGIRKPFAATQPDRWLCDCLDRNGDIGKEQRGYLTRCPDCKAERDGRL